MLWFKIMSMTGSRSGKPRPAVFRTVLILQQKKMPSENGAEHGWPKISSQVSFFIYYHRHLTWWQCLTFSLTLMGGPRSSVWAPLTLSLSPPLIWADFFLRKCLHCKVNLKNMFFSGIFIFVLHSASCKVCGLFFNVVPPNIENCGVGGRGPRKYLLCGILIFSEYYDIPFTC